ncbi:MAG TPA: hypothetical protein VK110_07530, partial [Salinisphaeraceae bacterium]|nr:hypothetical protein [Salinisphaeraceae bacterium]
MGAHLDNHLRGITIAACGTFIISFDALLVRLAATTSWNVVFWRGLLMCLSLFIYLLVRGARRRWIPGNRREAIVTLVLVLLFGANTALFVISVSNTLVANTVVILS